MNINGYGTIKQTGIDLKKMILILLFLCIFQLSLPNKSNGFKSERTIYNQMLENFSLQIYVGIPWTKCLEKCKSIRNCKSANFIRRSGFCQLKTEDHIYKPETLKQGIGYMFSAKSEWAYTQPVECSKCSDAESCSSNSDYQCIVVGCPELNHVPVGITVLGNLFHVGAKRLYKCDKSGEQEVRVCQQDGSWSPGSLNCSIGTCARPVIENASVNLTENNDGTTVATVSCNTGFFHKSVNIISCNNNTLEWDNLEEVGCIEITVDSWTKVYRTVSSVRASNVIYSWKLEGSQDIGEYRNDEIVSFWEEASFDSVKVEIIDSEDDTINCLLFDRYELVLTKQNTQ